MDDLLKMRDLFRKAADNIDEIVAIDERQKAGESLDDQMEDAQAKFLLTLMKLQTMSSGG